MRRRGREKGWQTERRERETERKDERRREKVEGWQREGVKKRGRQGGDKREILLNHDLSLASDLRKDCKCVLAS